MGTLAALDMMEYCDFEQSLRWHLTGNHYPPIPLDLFLQPCIEAINAGNDADWDRPITLPDGVSFRDSDVCCAHDLIEFAHLDCFIDYGEDY